jgi:formyltetrahydrofolate deformylase
MNPETTARLLITCPDRPGIVAAVSNLLYNHAANITDLDQHSTDPEGGTFFMRLEFQTPHPEISRPALERSFQERVASHYGMHWRLRYASQSKKLALLVSRHDHALLEVLWRWSRGELPAVVTRVISNHPDLREAVEGFGVPYFHVPIRPETREDSEQRVLELLDDNADVVVLARYMQILSPGFVDRFPDRIINIHHSFLPAFAGADPYRQAGERGVKLIGATAHFVTRGLDEGPIIEQDVIRVSHRHSVAELRELGRDIERTVLARAVKWFLEDRIIVDGNKTVVFA